MDWLYFCIAGGVIGFIIGLTGVGGGSFMTPFLLAFGIPLPIAIGTDLLYAAFTKASGVIAHAQQKTVDWSVVKWLSLGSIPASGATTVWLHYYNIHGVDSGPIMLKTLGFMLIVTAVVVCFRPLLLKYHNPHKPRSKILSFLQRHSTVITCLMGVFLGILVTLSSVGAGAFCAAILFILYPKMRAVTVVGTDIAHAVPLTFVAGLGHTQLGHVDFTLLFILLLGSIPMIWIGSRLSNRIPSRYLQPFMALALLLIGLKYVFS